MNAIPHVRASFCSWLLSRPASTPRTRFLFRVVGRMADPVNGAAVGDEMDAEQDNPTGGVTYLCGGEYRYFFSPGTIDDHDAWTDGSFPGSSRCSQQVTHHAHRQPAIHTNAHARPRAFCLITFAGLE